MIPTVDNYVRWFVCSIRYRFLRDGYAFLDFDLPQVADEGFPTHTLLTESARAVALRFATPVGETTPPVRWKSPADLIGEMPEWLYCAFPTSADALDQQLTHDKVVLAAADDVVRTDEGLRYHGGLRLQALADGLADGTLGLALSDALTPSGFLGVVQAHQVDLVLVLNAPARTAMALIAERNPE